MNATCTWWTLTLPEGCAGSELWANALADKLPHSTVSPKTRTPAHRLRQNRMNIRLPLWSEGVLQLLPSKKEADIARHPAGIFEYLGLQPEAERSQVFTPEFKAELGAALQSLVP